MDEQPTVIAGRYDLISPLATGGMGTVYRARDRQLQRDVALKLMRPGLGRDAEFAERFALEARRTARFSHPNIVAIHDYGTDKGNQYIVMELVGGGNLADLIARRGRLSPERSVRIAAEVAAALQIAHRHGIVHRDVKPANVLLTPEGTAKLTDLGVAQAADDAHITPAGGALGTPIYLSPEQVEGKGVGPATDIYALGIVLFEMLTGHRPFTGQSPSAVAMSRLTTDPPDPRSTAPDIPPELAAIVLRCLALDPAKRYRSSRALGIALRGWLSRQASPTAASVPTERQSAPAHVAPPTQVVPAPPPGVRRRDKEAANWWLLALVLVLLAVTGFAGQRLLASRQPASPSDGLTGVLSSPTSFAPPATSSPELAVLVTPKPATPMPATPQPNTPAPTVQPTPAAATSPPVTEPPRTPAPTSPPVVAAAADSPSQTVARFYQLVADGKFDRAYGLWSQGMRNTYPRTENLDRRFDDTASIAIHRLDLLQQDPAYAAAGVEFTETYANGSWRRFDGSWELVRIHGEWLLDAPHF